MSVPAPAALLGFPRGSLGQGGRDGPRAPSPHTQVAVARWPLPMGEVCPETREATQSRVPGPLHRGGMGSKCVLQGTAPSSARGPRSPRPGLGPVSGRVSRAAGAFSQPRPPRCPRTRPACPAHAPPIRPTRPSRGPASSAPLHLFGVSPPSVFCVGSRTDVRGTPTAPEAQRGGPRAVGRKFSPRRPLLTWHGGVRRGAGAAACSA